MHKYRVRKFQDTSKSQSSPKLSDTKSIVGPLKSTLPSADVTPTSIATSQRDPESTPPDVAQSQQEESGYDSDQVKLLLLLLQFFLYKPKFHFSRFLTFKLLFLRPKFPQVMIRTIPQLTNPPRILLSKNQFKFLH